jgi:hypothetical protein
VAAGLVIWSVLAIRRRRLLPVRLGTQVVVLSGLALLGYWLARLMLQFRFGMRAFAAFP